MSTIATPRDPPRRIPSSQAITPTSSARPSIDAVRSGTSSPNPGGSSGSGAQGPPAPTTNKRANRAALREYYNLKKAAAAAVAAAEAGTGAAGSATPSLEVTDAEGETSYSEVPPSELDAAGFDAEAHVARALEGSSLGELLRGYTRVLGEVRALDAEKKALVYDNYSKLIAATETIRKMRSTMDPLNPMAATLDPAVGRIYDVAAGIRDGLRGSVPPPDETGGTEKVLARRRRTQRLAVECLEAPDRVRRLVREGRMEDARNEWDLPRRLLETWLEKGLGGDDIQKCLDDGEAALRGDDTPS